MARTALQKVYADFRQGFVTVANPLAYPEGSLKDIVNFDIQDNGTLRLRAGLRQETEATVDLDGSVEDINNLAISTHIWENVRNSGDERIAVVQVGTNIHLFNMLDDGIDVENKLATIDLFIPSTGVNKNISVATGAGWLFIAHPDIRPKVIKRTGTTSFTKDSVDIKIRDLAVWEGLTNEQTGLEKTSKLFPQHRYNLENGGWPSSCIVSNEANPDAGTGTRDPILYTEEKIGVYPPIYTPFAAGKAGGGDDVSEQNAYNPFAIENNYFGNTPIPVGSNIIDAHFWSRTGIGNALLNPSDPLSNIVIKEYSWTQNPSSIEFYAGRVWYAGAKGYNEFVRSSLEPYVKKDNLDVSNTIYFSQQFDSEVDKIGRCYQENDPTGEDINQLLATDGGTLSIRGAGEILDIKTFGTALVVFSDQGVWTVSGIDANSFKADGFSVDKISNIGPATKDTIAATNNSIYYIANDAIYVLATDEVTGLPKPQDITSGKIKDFYTNLPVKEKKRAKGLFDTSNRNFYMFYTDGIGIPDSVRNLYYNKVLVFNQDQGSFYKYDLAVNSKYIVDGLFYNKDAVTTIQEPITLDGAAVTVDAEPVTLDSTYSTAALNALQLVTVVDDGTSTAKLTFSSFTDITDFKDFGEDYEGFVEFGFDTAGDIMRDSYKAPVLISHMERTEDGFEINPNDPNNQELILTNTSGCLLSYGWDWATNYKNPMQIYRFHRNYVPSGTDDPFNYGIDVITTRNRIRGKGHSLGIRLDSEAGKDCRILGIGILYTAAKDI